MTFVPRVSVIVVSYATREQLRRCLSRIEPEHETIVVDNGSQDGSPEMVREEFPLVRLIEAGENLGFGRANNRGAAVATGALLLFLNSDCYAEPGAIAALARNFEDHRVAGAGGKLLNPNGSLQDSTANEMTLLVVVWEQLLLEKLLPIYWTTRKRLRLSERSGRPVQTAQAMGACLMCRREGFPRFDERFFLYMEDTMLCDRLRERGVILYDPSAVFVHELGASSRGEWWRGIARYNAGKELYFRLTYGEASARICRCVNRIGALLRIVVKPRKAAGFWRVFQA